MPESSSGTSSSGTSAPEPKSRSWSVSAAVVLVVVGVLVLVGALGGFEKRTDLLRSTAVGAPITTGPYVFTFTGATAQRKKGLDDKPYWQVSAIGTGRTTGNISIAPSYDDNGTFVSQDRRSSEIEPPDGVRYGSTGSFTQGSQFTPGLPPVSFQVDFKYSPSYVPDVTLRFVVFELEFTDQSLLGGEDKTWHATNHGYDIDLPVRLLPEATS